MKNYAIAAAAFGVGAVGHTMGHVSSSHPTATIDGGVIIGTVSSVPGAAISVNQFLGIPFASAPAGTLRFAPPRPTAWSQPLDTTAFKPACIQVFSPYGTRNFVQDVFSSPRPDESEDCLYINVFAPNKSCNATAEEPLPVLYWLYGGGLVFGNAGQPMYDGSHFAALEHVVVVTVNYRTNLFGFPIAPDIKNLTERNLGLLDQRAGLEWVQHNIRAFGGDPDRVTIFGQSAGSLSVDVLLTSEWPKDDTPADKLRYAQENSISFGTPAGDDKILACDPRLRRETGRFAQVPVIGGSNVDDGSYYGAKIGPDIDRYFNSVFPNETELKASILGVYNLNPAEGRVDNCTRLGQIHTDWNFKCPAVFLSNSSTRYVPTYRYLFNATFPNQRLTSLPDLLWPISTQGAYHQSEVPIVFSTYDRTGATEEQKALSDTMRSAWARFARDPGSPPIEGWEVAGVDGLRVMDFGVDEAGGVKMVTDRTGNCAAWKDFILRKHL
ncbi:Alpha/Beta hydrolase protein [Massariosphaeria phaeospora]|uniref:Carboxylic ester hydrolase n=1 Tax=Massariosphaeria phaeospora TaxID=100035 RepID=A0A7C8IHC4_9PLEO|nr:Alpha/Beta hydrolase protein [Massariosphaeria phaeospora]